ncbi:hypothetical protein TNCV_3114821 [Trichonephila clavipes]|nr:hypothetical protein TNCV_3114821 [Trichonephila clavipes]
MIHSLGSPQECIAETLSRKFSKLSHPTKSIAKSLMRKSGQTRYVEKAKNGPECPHLARWRSSYQPLSFRYNRRILWCDTRAGTVPLISLVAV